MAGGVNPFGFTAGIIPAPRVPRQPQDLPSAPFGFAPPPSKMAQTLAILNEYNPLPAFERLLKSPMALGGPISEQDIADGLMVSGTVTGGSAAAPKPKNALNMGIRAYHGSPQKGLTRLSTRHAIETPNTVFAAGNRDVADTFTVPREYGEPVYYDEFGEEIEPGEVLELSLTPKNPLSVPAQDAQRFIDDTTFQTRFVNDARQKGHDMVVAPNVMEGIGERYEGDVYAVLDDSIISIVRKYGIAGASAMLGYNILDGMDPAQADELKRIEGNQ